MRQRKGKKIFIYFLFLLIFGSINNINLNNAKFNTIEKLSISGLDKTNNEIILKQIKNLNLENIFFLDVDKIKKIISTHSLVEEYQVFKEYPSTVNVEIKKTIFLARINRNNQIFIIGSNGKLIKNNSSLKELPYIFGNPEISEFLNFKKILKESSISYDRIQNLYFFKSKRWDIELKNNILIKLSGNNIKESLDNAFEFMSNTDLSDIKVIDARIKNQIILNG